MYTSEILCAMCIYFVNSSLAVIVREKKDFSEDGYDSSNITVIIEALQEMVSLKDLDHVAI